MWALSGLGPEPPEDAALDFVNSLGSFIMAATRGPISIVREAMHEEGLIGENGNTRQLHQILHTNASTALRLNAGLQIRRSEVRDSALPCLFHKEKVMLLKHNECKEEVCYLALWLRGKEGNFR